MFWSSYALVSGGISIGHLVRIGTPLYFGVSYLLAKRLTDLASPDMVVALLSIGVRIGLIPLTIPVWITPTVFEVAILFAVAVFLRLPDIIK